jgi:hypothetical protein
MAPTASCGIKPNPPYATASFVEASPGLSAMVRRDDEDFELAARNLRLEVGINDRFCPDMIYVLSQLKRLGRIKDFIRVPDGQIKDDASYDSSERVVRIRESAFQLLDRRSRASKQDRRRARFTIAHELGHMTFSHDGRFFRGPTTDAAIKVGSRIRYPEVEANKFAAAFLMPSHLARPDMASEDMSELFDINISAAILRKETLARLDRRARGVDRSLPKGVVDWLRGQRAKGYNISSLDREDARKRAQRKKGGEPEGDK